MKQETSSNSSAGKHHAVVLLTKDHQKVLSLFKAYERFGSDEMKAKAECVAEICRELRVHAQVEEDVFYPVVRAALDENDLLNEAEVEHDVAKELIEQLESMRPDDELFDATVTVLAEYVEHHIREEQDEMFPRVKKAKVDTVDLGDAIAERKQVLMDGKGGAVNREKKAVRN